jgi:YVTN family beta-propeller protein
MRSLISIAVAVAAVFASSALAQDAKQSIGKRQLSGTVYTADERGNSISAIDLASGKVTIIPVSISPHNVQIAADGKRLFAVGDPASTAHGHDKGAHAAGEVTGRLLVLDSGKLSAGVIASIQVGRHPAHVVVDRSGRRAFVTNSGDNAVTEIDIARKNIVRSVPTGPYPHGMRISPDGRELYVANVEDGSVSVIDMQSLKEVDRIPVGRAPVQVGFTPDGTRVYVSLRDENAVAWIDTASRKKIGTVAVGRGPIQVHATPDGRFVYVANQGSEAEPSETVSIIETASGSVKTIRTGAGAHGVAVSDDGRFVFISNILANTVSVIDTSSQAVVADFPVGKGPNGITFRPDGRRGR